MAMSATTAMVNHGTPLDDAAGTDAAGSIAVVDGEALGLPDAGTGSSTTGAHSPAG
jgi:hypothetical protein